MKCIALNKELSKVVSLSIIIFSSFILASCNKDNTDEDGYDTDKYSVLVSDYGDDKYAREVIIHDYSKSQKLKWKVFFQYDISKKYFRIFPTEGIGSGSFIVRLTDPNYKVYDCPIDIFFEKESGKTSCFSPHIGFQYLQ